LFCIVKLSISIYATANRSLKNDVLLGEHRQK
jgi:hypothetical protein